MHAGFVAVALRGVVQDAAACGGANRSGGEEAYGMPTYFVAAAVAVDSFVAAPITTPFLMVTEGAAAAASACGRHEAGCSAAAIAIAKIEKRNMMI